VYALKERVDQAVWVKRGSLDGSVGAFEREEELTNEWRPLYGNHGQCGTPLGMKYDVPQ